MGLMGRPGLAADEGLYIPGNSIHMFFMRFPIDALFVGKPDATGTREVVACRPDLSPWTGLVLPVRGAEGVVELPAGTIERAGLQAGAAVRFEASGSSPTGTAAGRSSASSSDAAPRTGGGPRDAAA